MTCCHEHGCNEPLTTQISIMVTRRCNMACAHCSVESSPHVKDAQPTEQELADIVRQAGEAGARGIQFTGGEPMIRAKLVLKLMKQAKKLGIGSAMSTNGFWGRSMESASRRLAALRRAGLSRLTVSYDRYHAAFQGPEPAVHIARAGGEQNFPVNINVTRIAGEKLDDIAAPFEGLPAARLRFYDVQAVGAAGRNIPLDQMRGEVGGFCSGCEVASITNDHRVLACNGPAYFTPPGHPLHLGTLREKPLVEFLRQHAADPILQTIRTFGPSRLRDELRQISGFENFPFRGRYSGMCELCLQITSDPEAVAALRRRLSDTKLAAERAAMRQIILVQRRTGALNRDEVNGAAAARVFLRAATRREERWGFEAAKVLGRADVDWNFQAHRLAASNLAGPMLAALHDESLKRWAPPFFIERVQKAAMRNALRETLQRDALKHISDALGAMGTTAVLLKGMAMIALADERPHGVAAAHRSTGDVDLWVSSEAALPLRAKLLEMGFKGEPNAARTGPHHLAPVIWQGVAVEIHTRIMPECWGLPEAAMLADARDLNVVGFDRLRVLSAEGMFLHAVVHATTHLFTHGLKTGWDLHWLIEHFGAAMNWPRVAQWAEAMAVPRAFWVPLRVLAEDLELNIPADFLSLGPNDVRARKLELIAHHRLFAALEGAFDLNPFTRTAVFLMMHDSLAARLRYVAWVSRGSARESRRSAQRKTAGQRLGNLGAQLRQSWAQWQSFRRARQIAGEID